MTTSEVLESVRLYLQDKKSETALSITGPWGSGKKYLYRTKIKDLIENTCYQDDEKYKSIYISLFGISSLRQIHDIIFFEPLASGWLSKFGVRSEHLRFGSTILKGVLAKFLDDEYLDNSEPIIDKTDDKIKKFSNPTQFVICFDDFEVNLVKS